MSKNKLFTPFQLASNIALKHRVALAPMTRSRADVNGVQPEYASTYYEQRASTPGTFLITEATQVSQEGQGYVLTPGIYTKEHVESWKKIVDTVHKKNSYIAAQLWHVGRLSHPSFQKDNELPVAPSAIAPKGDTYTKNFEKVPYVVPRELTVGDIQRIIGEFEHAAKCAKEAGFRFVELHSGNGYLLDQFLQDGTNKRKDLYGGSYANRSRFLLELVNAVKSVYGAENIGVRLSPWGSFGDMSESNTVELFSHVISELDKSKIGYLHLVEPGAGDGSDGKFLPQQSSNTFRPLFKGTLIAAGGYTKQSATKAIESGTADIVAFGRPFLANPDLQERFMKDAELNAPNYNLFYTGGPNGYIDYPFLNAEQKH